MLKKLYKWYGKKTVLSVVAGTVILLLVGLFFRFSGTPQESEVGPELRRVQTASLANVAQGETRTFSGRVEASGQVRLESEISGRVVALPVELGQAVSAGQVIARLDSSAQNAAVIQARGAYEAARAGAAQSDSGLREAEIALAEAKNQANTVAEGAYAAVSNVLRVDVDQFFANPASSVPGLRINGFGHTSFLNNERVAFETILPNWLAQSQTVSDEPAAALGQAEVVSNRLLTMVDTLIEIVNADRNSQEVLHGQPIATYRSSLIAARDRLTNTIQSVRSARSRLASAEETLARSEIGGTSGAVSLSNAQIEQARGALAAAEAQLAKTVIRTPIAGTINTLPVKVGELISAFSLVTEVVNDDIYEIRLFLNEAEKANINIGDSVTVNGRLSGSVSHVAPALDRVSQKIEVIIAVDSRDLISGSTATVTFPTTSAAETATSAEADGRFLVPISAISFGAHNGSLLLVEEGQIVTYPVELGRLRGVQIEVTTDLDPATEIVIDARGLRVGQMVETEN